MSKQVNPLEEMTELLAEDYVEMVNVLTEHFAPVRPWWDEELSGEQQLWRWVSGPREEIIAWIMRAGLAMGWVSAEEILKNWEQIFTSSSALDLIPPQIQVEVPIALLEMVQAAGPKDAGNHLRKMERMVAGRAEAVAALAVARENQPNVPEPPDFPAVFPTELFPNAGTGWPNYGFAPRETLTGR